MTWKMLNKTPTESNARDVFVLNRISDYISSLGINPKILSDKDINITRQAILVIKSMTGFDRKNVMKDIYKIIKNPHKSSLIKHRVNPFWRIARNINPFTNYHFLILYRVSDIGSIVIEEIMIDNELHGSKLKSKQQRTMLYDVRKKRFIAAFRGKPLLSLRRSNQYLDSHIPSA